MRKPRLALLQLSQRIVSFHGARERILHAAECVVKLRHAIERKLHREKFQVRLPEYFLQSA